MQKKLFNAFRGRATSTAAVGVVHDSFTPYLGRSKRPRHEKYPKRPAVMRSRDTHGISAPFLVNVAWRNVAGTSKSCTRKADASYHPLCEYADHIPARSENLRHRNVRGPCRKRVSAGFPRVAFADETATRKGRAWPLQRFPKRPKRRPGRASMPPSTKRRPTAPLKT